MADTDDATNALIAKLLAQDNPYDHADDYAGYDTDDSEYGSGVSKKRKRQTKKAPAKASRKRNDKQSQPAEQHTSGAQDAQETAAGKQQEEADQVKSATGRVKRKDAGRARTEPNKWTDAEEALFLEALNLHGRDWLKCAEHVGTRDSRAISSHAQKYFIKLCIAGEHLPAKVAESGEGYTLSGKLLDPYSASANAYGLKPHLVSKILAANLPGVLRVDAPAADKVGQEGKENCKSESNSDAAAAAPPKPVPAKRARPAPKTEAPAPAPPAEEAPAAPAARTKYAMARPRREAASRAALGETTESLELTRLFDFVGPPGCGAPAAQPFHVLVAAQANLVMDLHAHLSTCEIIGLLGGTWDPETRAIHVEQAFPCAQALGSHSGTSVELDPEAEVATRAAMEAQGLTPVGWYHSHPIFEPKPSAKDNDNQRNYQALFRCETSKLEPFLGAIVGPYDAQLPSEASVINWWVVQTKNGGLVPYHIRYIQQPMAAMPDAALTQKLYEVVDTFKDDIGRVDLSEPWRPFTSLVDGLPQGPAVSKIAKLRAALQRHLPREQHDSELQAWLDALTAHISSSWDLELPASKRVAGTALEPATVVQADGQATIGKKEPRLGSADRAPHVEGDARKACRTTGQAGWLSEDS